MPTLLASERLGLEWFPEAFALQMFYEPVLSVLGVVITMAGTHKLDDS